MIMNLVSYDQAEKYPSAPLLKFDIGLAGAGDPGLRFATSLRVEKYRQTGLSIPHISRYAL